jgi:hypothetical protein
LTNKNSRLKVVKDPYGNEIVIQNEIADFTQQINCMYDTLDNLSTAIEKPAIMIKVNGTSVQLYYMRAIGWNKILLVCGQKNHDHFEVTNCEVETHRLKTVGAISLIRPTHLKI